MLLQLFGASVFIHTDVYEASEVVGPCVCLWTCTYIFVCVREEKTGWKHTKMLISDHFRGSRYNAWVVFSLLYFAVFFKTSYKLLHIIKEEIIIKGNFTRILVTWVFLLTKIH